MKKMILLGVALIGIGCSKDDDDSTASGKLTLTGSGTSEGNVVSADGGNPEELMVKVYSLHASLSEDCTNPIEIFTKADADAEYVDFLSGPTLGEGNLALGDYPCVMIGMDSLIKFTPDDSASKPAECTAGQEYEINVCRSGYTSTDPAGDEIECKDDDSSKVTLYLSTVSESTGGGQGNDDRCDTTDGYNTYCNTFAPPSDDYPNRGIKLGAALTIKAATASTFVVDGTGQVQAEQGENGGAAECGMQPPAFSFE